MTSLPETTDLTILVIDDTLDNLRLLGKILEAQHYTVLKSLNGKMAIQAAHRNPPDLILLDVNMPEMNGYEVCQHLKASPETADIPIIFISALDQIDNKIRAFEMGGQDYITKPFQELEVLARVQNQLLIRQQKQQLQHEIEIRHQAEVKVRLLNQHLEQMNSDLERQVHLRTLELQQALSFELVLKQITDQVRDSLDQHQIIQTVVETLSQALKVHCCKAILYSADRPTSLIQHQWTEPGCTVSQEQSIPMVDFPEVYKQLQEREYVVFSQIQPTSLPDHLPNHLPDHAAILACPIFDHQVEQAGILGDLWLFREAYSSFGEAEIRLAQQAANQCAIALRQARLYEAAQAQVKELERLNQLKDDFLSTISHELRTPIASMKMVINLLSTMTSLESNVVEAIANASNQNEKIIQYIEVLKDECDRELALVEDLLNLQHIEAGTYSSQLSPVCLQDFLLYLIEPFETRLQNQQQSLDIAIEPDLPVQMLDAFSFNRVVTELLSNACKYTPAGEKISISLSILDEPTTSNSSRYLQLIISNTGSKIDCEELSRIFDKFYRIPNNDPWKYGGTGLGLALVKKLVEQMGGTINAESTEHQTTFVVKLALH